MIDTDTTPTAPGGEPGTGLGHGSGESAPAAPATPTPAVTPTPTVRSALSRRRRIVAGVAGAAVLVSGGGLIGATMVKSPAQAAADTKAPRPQWLTAPVQKKVLASTLVLRGTVASSTSFSVSAAGAATQGAATQVVTGVHVKTGDTVAPGTVLVDISGRPLLALAGTTPAYRDLKPGSHGADVAELQDALRKLGYPSAGDDHGTFGPATKSAVTRFYEHLGYDVPTTGGADDAGDKQALQAAQTAVDAAQRAVDDLQRQIAASRSQPTPASPAPGSEPPALQMQYLRKALEQAEQSQADLIATTGPMMPLAEFVFLPSLPAQVASVAARVGGGTSGSLVTLTTGKLGVTTQLAPAQGQLLKAGMKVDLVAEALGTTATGTIGTIGAVTTIAPQSADAPADSGGGSNSGSGSSGSGQPAQVAPYIPVTVIPDTALASNWNGQDVRLTITAASTPAAVLVVPAAAVSSGADGRTTVSKLGANGAPVPVPVTTGLSADGFVEITPADAADLTEVDSVVVGQ